MCDKGRKEWTGESSTLKKGLKSREVVTERSKTHKMEFLEVVRKGLVEGREGHPT